MEELFDTKRHVLNKKDIAIDQQSPLVVFTDGRIYVRCLIGVIEKPKTEEEQLEFKLNG